MEDSPIDRSPPRQEVAEAEPLYGQVLDFMRASGKRLIERAGKIADIGITKTYLTEEDLRIEREFKELIRSFGEGHVLFAEEENATFPEAENVWVVDPISGTRAFLQGEPHYAIVVAHTHKGEVRFAAIYDPSADELYVARAGKGASINDVPIHTRARDIGSKPEVILRVSQAWSKPEVVERLNELLEGYDVATETGSMAISYGRAARGIHDGVISLTKDVFPEFAGSLLVSEAGGAFTNLEGDTVLHLTDRIFVVGNMEVHPELLTFVQEATKS